MTLIQIAALIALGSFTGFCAGLLGIGGGMMLVPFLTFLFSIYGFPLKVLCTSRSQHLWQPFYLRLYPR